MVGFISPLVRLIDEALHHVDLEVRVEVSNFFSCLWIDVARPRQFIPFRLEMFVAIFTHILLQFEGHWSELILSYIRFRLGSVVVIGCSQEEVQIQWYFLQTFTDLYPTFNIL